MACGAPSELKVADKEIQKICDQVKSAVEEKLGLTYTEFKAVSYKTQVVAGTNYFIKVKVGDSSFVHLRVFRSLPHAGLTVELSDAKTGMKEEDSLDYF